MAGQDDTARGTAARDAGRGVGMMALAGLASLGAGAIHAGAIGIHADHPSLARLFVAVAVAQLGIGLLALVRGGRPVAGLVAAVNLGAVAAWAVTRIWDVPWVAGLEQAEAPGFADTVCAALGAVAAAGALAALVRRRATVSGTHLGLPAVAVAGVAVAAMFVGADHVHGGGEAADHAHGGGEATAAPDPVDDGGEAADDAHGGEVASRAGSTTIPAEPAPAEWPRPWDPAVGEDFSGVPGVTRAQQLRAAGLVHRTLADLPRFADVDSVGALGYRTIGDAATGYEHYVNYAYLDDGRQLDPTVPESLVYRVDGDRRTLVSAMYIVAGTAVDDPELVDFGGPLMQWHVHENLCWAGGDDGPRVVGVVDSAGNCPAGSVNAGGGNPMVHVWIVPHECGPFAALEGHGAGQVGDATTRADQCTHGDDHNTATDHDPADHDPADHDSADHDTAGHDPAGHDGDHAAADPPGAYDPDRPIDLSGTPGVTAEQQAFAENLVAVTLVDLPKWADPAVAEAAGFRSIGDGATGHEHFINWAWINDDVFLDPDHPESLVYQPQPDGSLRLVSAMYMLPSSYTLADVPDWGGALMQWHVHDNLCFDTSGEAPRVAGLTDAEGACTAPLVKLGESPMIHVWIVPNECGPFAPLEGIGAGQVADGEVPLCDHAHGSQ